MSSCCPGLTARAAIQKSPDLNRPGLFYSQHRQSTCISRSNPPPPPQSPPPSHYPDQPAAARQPLSRSRQNTAYQSPSAIALCPQNLAPQLSADIALCPQNPASQRSAAIAFAHHSPAYQCSELLLLINKAANSIAGSYQACFHCCSYCCSPQLRGDAADLTGRHWDMG